jgi:conjugal transfer ATP-binding protein TraC
MSISAALKALFVGERSAPADSVPRSLLNQIASVPRLTGILPYLGWLETERLFVLDQGVFGDASKQCLAFCIETMPQTGANDEMERVLTSMFMSCPPGTGIQFTLYATPHILPVLRTQANMLPVDQKPEGGPWEDRRNRNIFRVLARQRIEYYLRGTRKPLFPNHACLLRDYRCVISVTVPMSPDVPSEVDEALRIRDSIHSTLRSAHLPGWDWQPNELLNFVADFFDPNRMFGRGHDNPIEYDEDRTLRMQISNLEVASVVSDDSIRLKSARLDHETAVQCFTVRQYPKYHRLGGMGSLIGDYYQMALSMPCPFLITMGAIIQDYESARTRAQLKSARATQSAGSYMAHFQPDLQDRKRDWDMVLKAFDNGHTVVQMYHQVVLLSDARDAAGVEHSVRSVWRARGFDLAKDIYLSHQALLGAMPGTLTRGLQRDLKTMGRTFTKTADNAVMTSPLIAEWKGTTNPMVTLFGRRGQIMGFDLFDNQGGNYNFAVAALSGSGKSVFVNELAFRYLGAGTKVWIIDVGRSYRNLCDLLDGEFIEFSDEKTNTICLNPFSMVVDINNDMEMLLPLISQMASPRGELDNYEYAAIASAIKNVWESKGTVATITDIYDLLKSGELSTDRESARDLSRLAMALEPYTKHGVYASYFEGASTIQFQKNFVVLELEELKSKKDLQAVVMQLMMYRITQEMYLDRSKRKLVVIDEAWDLLGSSGGSAAFIEAGYRRARKYGGSFGTITQSVEDYYKNEASKAAIQNADWMFLLRQKPESIDRLGKEGKLHVDEWIRRQLSSVSTAHGQYSEIFVHGPMGSGVGRLILDPFSMLLYSTRAEDFQAIKNLTEQGMSVTEAIEHILSTRGTH